LATLSDPSITRLIHAWGPNSGERHQVPVILPNRINTN
jgi:hypothetical protein